MGASRYVAVIALLLAGAGSGCGNGDQSTTTSKPLGTTTVPATTTGSTTTPPTTTSPPTTTTTNSPTTSTSAVTSPPTAPAAEQLRILRPDGIGSVDFGTSADQAIAALTQLLGAPRSDVSATTECPSGPARVDRKLEWDRPYLRVVLTNWDEQDFAATVPMHLSYWGAGVGPPDSLRLATPEGIAPGSTVGELRGFDPHLEISAGGEPFGQVQFAVDVPSGTVAGYLDTTIGAADMVRAMQAALNAGGAQLAIDGVWGPETSQALTRFAAHEGIDGEVADSSGPVVGQPLYDTLERLGLPPDDVTVIWIAASNGEHPCPCTEGECDW